MTTLDVLKLVGYAVRSSCGLVVVLTPVNSPIPRPYVTISLVSDKSITQGGKFLREDKLVQEWLGELLIDVNFYISEQNTISRVRGSLKSLTDFTSDKSVNLIYIGDLRELTNSWESQVERRFVCTLTVRAPLSQVISESENNIQIVPYESTLKI